MKRLWLELPLLSRLGIWTHFAMWPVLFFLWQDFGFRYRYLSRAHERTYSAVLVVFAISCVLVLAGGVRGRQRAGLFAILLANLVLQAIFVMGT